MKTGKRKEIHCAMIKRGTRLRGNVFAARERAQVQNSRLQSVEFTPSNPPRFPNGAAQHGAARGSAQKGPFSYTRCARSTCEPIDGGLSSLRGPMEKRDDADDGNSMLRTLSFFFSLYSLSCKKFLLEDRFRFCRSSICLQLSFVE